MGQDPGHSEPRIPANDEIARDNRARQLQSSRLRVALFKGLQVDDQASRQAALEKIIQVVKSYMRVARSPFSPVKNSVSSSDSTATTTPPTAAESSAHAPNSRLAGTHDEAKDNVTCDEAGETDEQLQYFLLTILRLSYTCPFRDVRQAFKEFLQITTDTTVPAPYPRHLSPSFFIPLKDIFSLESTNSLKSAVYPRPANLSFSPWSQETNSSDSLEKTPVVDIAEKGASRGTAAGGRPSDDYVRQMMVNTFMDEGRLHNLFRVLVFFPTFHEVYQHTYIKILKAPIGPLHRTWKSYLAIMASAEQKCQYLISILKLDFLQNGGEPSWLNGIKHCPPKLQSISRLVLKMARQPWRLSEDDALDWMRSQTALMGDTWSKGELVQAVVIVASFLGLSSFVLGCGIAPELDMRGGYFIRGMDDDHLDGVEYELSERLPCDEEEALKAASIATGWHDSQTCLDDEALLASDGDERVHLGGNVRENLPSHAKEENETDTQRRTKDLIRKLKLTKEPLLKEELQESLQDLKIADERVLPENTGVRRALTIRTLASAEGLLSNCSWRVNAIHEDLARFASASSSVDIEEFQAQHSTFSEFMLDEYCWEDHGCDLVNHFLPDIGDQLDDEFNEALSITDWSIYHTEPNDIVNTTPLRHAVWYYTQQLFGVTKEDYDYADIQTYLNEFTKDFIRKVCRRPHEVGFRDWANVGIDLRPEEKCHINLLIASAKKQALLCYGLAMLSEL